MAHNSWKRANCDNCGRWANYHAVWNESHTTFRALCDLCFDLERSIARKRAAEQRSQSR